MSWLILTANRKSPPPYPLVLSRRPACDRPTCDLPFIHNRQYQACREPQWGPGKPFRGAPNIFTGKKFLIFSKWYNSAVLYRPISGRRLGAPRRRGARGSFGARGSLHPTLSTGLLNTARLGLHSAL